jgi:hypothetical protein
MNRSLPMFNRTLCLSIALLVSAQPSYAQQPDASEVPGYRHTVEKSRFFAGESVARMKVVEENGFTKYQGRDGVLAIDQKTGLALALRSDGGDKASRVPATARASPPVLDPDEHNKRVVDYFVRAGLPRDQVSVVHANTYLSASGPTSKASSIEPRVDGYATIVSRKAGGFDVVDSVAWARIDGKGHVLGEWVYWPPIPTRVVDDARRLNEMLNGSGRGDFLSRIPSAQKSGKVVIRHASPFAGGGFEAFASYDVMERNDRPERGTTSVHVRHFDAEGREFRLPQEMRNVGADYPPKEIRPAAQ